jgi:hypothetical protein
MVTFIIFKVGKNKMMTMLHMRDKLSSLLNKLFDGHEPTKNKSLNKIIATRQSKTVNEEIVFPTLTGSYEGRLPFFPGKRKGIREKLNNIKDYIKTQPTLVFYSIYSPLSAFLSLAGGFLATSQGRAYLANSIKNAFSKSKELETFSQKDSELEKWMKQRGYFIKEIEDGWIFYAYDIENGDPKNGRELAYFVEKRILFLN